MKKIISLFKRNYEGDRLVYDEIVLGAEWVVSGQGIATRKWDGTCCMVRDGRLYKRYDRKQDKRSGKHKIAPPGWEAAQQEADQKTGHWPGWVPVGNGPEDRWHRDAINSITPDGTYELCGPKVQGNPEGLDRHVLIPHGRHFLPAIPVTFGALKNVLAAMDIEGIVWHHPDGRMVKIKGRDFGLERKKSR